MKQYGGYQVVSFIFALASVCKGELNCNDVFNDPQQYSISAINQCYKEEKLGKAVKKNRVCPKLSCNKTCMFGYLEDSFGCPTCVCKKGKETLFEGDIMMSSEDVDYVESHY